MAPKLNQYLKDNPAVGFRSAPQYFASGDYLTYFVEDADYYAKRLDDVVTVYLTKDSDRFVGCKVKGVAHILRTLGEFGVGVKGAAAKLGLLFLVGAASNPGAGELRMKWYDLLNEHALVDFSPPSVPAAG